MAQYTQEELVAFAKRVLAQKDRDKAKGKAQAEAIKRLIATHRPEYEKLLKEARVNQGVV